jgi:DNA-binding transcriptional ArsR family regulator
MVAVKSKTESLDSYKCAKALKAMGDPTRLRILRHLIGKEKNVSQLVEELGVDQPIVSHHLSLLRHSGLVLERRSGKNIFYELHSDVAHHLSHEEEKIDFGCCSVQLKKE